MIRREMKTVNISIIELQIFLLLNCMCIIMSVNKSLNKYYITKDKRWLTFQNYINVIFEKEKPTYAISVMK